ncbi:MAG TPA: glycosyltransferase family A protein [Acidimicrobiales bacterium]|nr:glycosyltransferase family A protein [Acidimicrobiales bacterium]
MILLSVVLPNYNHARYLPGALDALLAQSRQADEVIVVDDGSTDDSSSVLERYAGQYPAIEVITLGRNEGVVAALNAGLARARGQYVYMAAADDLVMPGFFELGLALLEQHPQLGLFTGTTVLRDRDSGREKGKRPAVWPRYSPGVVTGERTARLLRSSDNWVLTGASLLSRAAIAEAGGLVPDLGSFADGFLVRKIALTHGFYFHPRPVAIWNVHRDSVSRRTATVPAEAARALELYTQRISDDPVFPPGYSARFDRRWRFAIARIALELPACERTAMVTIVARQPVDRRVLLRLAPRLPLPLATVTSLAWLYLRLRPTTLRGLLASRAAARMFKA